MNLQASIRIPRRPKDGETGDGIVNTVISYAKSESGTTPPITGWTSILPTPTQGWYLWTRTVATYRIRPATTTYSVSSYAKDGKNGLPGQIPIQKEWVVGDVHRNTDEIVDYIYVRGANKAQSYWYKLSAKGTVTADAPPTGGTTPSGYLRIDWLKELAVDVLLAEEANVAGFIFKGNQLISERGTVDGVPTDYSGQANFVPNLILNGAEGDVKITGTVNATSGSIGGWSIDGLGIRSEVGSGAYIKVEESGGRFIRINENPNSAMVSIRTDNGAGVRIYTQRIDGVGLSISGQTGARAINSYGSHEFYQRPSETWNAPGMLMALTLELRRMAQVGFSTNIFEHKWHISSLNGPIASRENGDVVRLTHNLGHTDYTPHATLNAGGGEVDKIVSYSNYFDMYLAGSWNYSSHRIQITVIGRNKI